MRKKIAKFFYPEIFIERDLAINRGNKLSDQLDIILKRLELIANKFNP